MDLSEPTPNAKDTQAEFILTELSIGLTLAAGVEIRRNGKEESRACARAAYDSALRFRGRVPLTREQSQEVQGKLEALKKRLQSLGETF